MRLTTLAGSIHILTVGLIAGIFIAVAATEPARIALDPSSFVQHQQTLHLIFAPMMRVLMLTAILSGVVWLILSRKQLRSAAFVLAAVSTAGAIAGLLLTLAVNVPINDMLMTWNVTAPPANVKELWMPWEHAHVTRTIIFIVAFIAAITANNLFRRADR